MYSTFLSRVKDRHNVWSLCPPPVERALKRPSDLVLGFAGSALADLPPARDHRLHVDVAVNYRYRANLACIAFFFGARPPAYLLAYENAICCKQIRSSAIAMHISVMEIRTVKRLGFASLPAAPRPVKSNIYLGLLQASH